VTRIVFAIFIFLAAAPARAYRPAKNPHYKRKPSGAFGVSASTQPLVDAIDRLDSGRWDPQVKFQLELFAAEHGKTSEGYDPAAPPVAVVGFDDAAIWGDLGEFVFESLVEHAAFKFDEDWWKLVPLAYGRQRIRAAQEQFIDLPPTVWDAQPAYHQFWKYMLKSYQDSCKTVDRKDCRIYIARLLKGFSRDEAAAYARKVFEEEEIAPLGTREIRESSEDQHPVRFRRGLRELPELKDLCVLLLKAGFEVWAVDLDAQPLLASYAATYGINPAKTAGIRLPVFREKFTGKTEEPIPWRVGKVDAVVAALGRPPALVVGASDGDRELLDYSGGLRLLLDRGNKPLRAYAEKRGWLIQPSFKP
jgi:phosphoserine phosphatase